MTLLQDLRYAVRLLVKDPWFTTVAAVALALGIGVNTTVFTFVNAVLIRGLPFDDPDRIMSLGTRDARGRDRGLSYLEFQDWREGTKAFSGLAAFSGQTMNISDEGRAPERFGGPYISSNAFKLIGERPALGRDFLPEDDRPGAPPVVILGNGVWKNRYGSDPGVIGRTIKVNELPATVIGVMPEGFKFPINADLWIPAVQLAGLADQKRDARNFEVFGRLADGVTPAQAQGELTAVANRLARDFPATNKDVVPTVMTFNERYNGGQIKLLFLSLMGAVGFVLLIACANVANLLLARSANRAREISVRVSLGATRFRVVRQLLVESILLAAISGVLGFGLSFIGIRLFDAAVADVGKPYWIKFTLDARVFGYLAAICLGTGIIFGLAPALHVSKTDVNEVLKEGGRSGSGLRARRWTSVLIVVELALTLVLLSGAGFMMRSLLVLSQRDTGVETAHILTMRLQLPNRKYPTPELRRDFYKRLDERLAALGNVQAATITTNPPMGGGNPRVLGVDGREPAPGEQPQTVTQVMIGPRYFETVGVRLARGRTFDENDGLPGHENAIVNQRFVAMHFPGEDPIGRRIRLTSEVQPGAPPPTPTIATIVGISPTIRQRNFQEVMPDPVVYLPLRSQATPFAMLMLRTAGDPAALTPAVREEVRALDPDLPLFGIQTLDQALAQGRWGFKVFGTMFTVLALIALALSAVGLYAITAYTVTQRTQEIGVRMALGAQATQVWWLILRGSIAQLLIGLTIGLAGAYGVGKLLDSLLVKSASRDELTLASIAVLLVFVSIVACFWPARRATQLDPCKALRYALAETLLQFQTPINGSDGTPYQVRACGAPMPDGLWEGWLEFDPPEGPPIRSPRETTQPNRVDTEYWASGLTPVYLEGALERARRGPVRVPVTTVRAPAFDGPAPATTVSSMADAAPHGILDPFSVYEKGEALLRKQLAALSAWHLVNIVLEHDLADGPAETLNALSAGALIEIIVQGVRREVSETRNAT
jgi:putative ABC transport system permease protein